MINRTTGEPILQARTADQYLAFTGANRTNIWPDIGPRLAPVKLVHRSCDLSKGTGNLQKDEETRINQLMPGGLLGDLYWN
jgi:hypothetical protein